MSSTERGVARVERRSPSLANLKAMVAKGVNQWRRWLPPVLVPAVVAIRTRWARRRPATWADAREQMRFVVGDDQPAEVIERLAAAYIERSIWRGESRWHPDLIGRQEVVGAEHLRALRAAGTGFIINFVHLGDYEGISPSLARAGIPNHNVATSDAFEPDAPVWLRQALAVVKSHEDVTALNVAVGSAGIRQVLAAGNAVAIATDQPGHTPVRFLGHELLLSSGAARIAKDMDVPVLVVTTHPNPAAPRRCGMFKVSEPLNPRDYDSVEALLEVMVRSHEAAFLAWPEAGEHPRRMLDRSLARPSTRHAPPVVPPS